MKRKIFSDYTFWLLIAANAYLIIYYIKFPDSINDIIVLFYIQSVLIGFFNFLDMLTLRHVTESNFKFNTEAASKYNGNGCVAWFFLIHYGVFHFVYLFFLATLIDIHKLDFRFIELSFFIILAACLSNFVHNKIRNKTEDVNIGVMFFMPYARIVPMHLMILLPAFFHLSSAYIFLILKTFADIIMHFVYQHAVFKSSAQNTTV